MTEARFEIRSRLRKYVPAAFNRLNVDHDSAKALVEALLKQLREKLTAFFKKKVEDPFAYL